ncbi:hypothetical protein HanPI659440_Chr11g0437101 [Helianthus annuus]|nr:hypothetical protein HanPI659440_Chr11g0437101 [Helianthus annuus]
MKSCEGGRERERPAQNNGERGHNNEGDKQQIHSYYPIIQSMNIQSCISQDL